MKTVRKAVVFLLRAILFAVGLFVAYGIFVFILSRIPVNCEDADPNEHVSIFVKSNGVHTDIVVPVVNRIKDWRTAVPFAHTVLKDSTFNYIGFGWGDKDFYLNTPEWSDLRVSTACNAMFYLGTSAVHTTFFHRMRESERCVKIDISNTEYRKIVDYISESFRDGAHPVVIPNAGYGKNDSFYEGDGRYSLFYSCNSWTNNALKAAGQKAALWTLTDTGILYHYQ